MLRNLRNQEFNNTPSPMVPKDWSGRIASLMMLLFAAIAFQRWLESKEMFFILLVFRDVLAAVYFWVRLPAREVSHLTLKVVAYGSAMLPLCYLGGSDSSIELMLITRGLAILGFLISTIATIDLGNSLGIAPAVRGGVCKTGIYKYLKHPMYTGYMVAEIGMVLLNPWNFLLFALSACLYMMRMRWENRFLSERTLH
ncbi:MAG: methyltransferase [Pseudomonadota bacterium]|nr:methyltransferase [Pseudomonadota bacterium]